MDVGTVGDCADAGCHNSAKEGSTPTVMFNWLTDLGYLDGTTNPPLIQNGQSCFTIYGGDMPKGTPPTDTAQWKADTEAWAAGGAQNN